MQQNSIKKKTVWAGFISGTDRWINVRTRDRQRINTKIFELVNRSVGGWVNREAVGQG